MRYNSRRGLGKGLGTGYKNLVPMDSHIHSLNAKGINFRKGAGVLGLAMGGATILGTMPIILINETGGGLIAGVGLGIASIGGMLYSAKQKKKEEKAI